MSWPAAFILWVPNEIIVLFISIYSLIKTSYVSSIDISTTSCVNVSSANESLSNEI